MSNKKQRQIRATLLAVGEGDTEEAFLKYLRSTSRLSQFNVKKRWLN